MTKCLWPNIGKQDVLEEYVTSQKAPSSSWRKSNESSDQFSSDVDETEVQSITQHNEESFDTTITYKSGTSSSLCSLKSNNTPVSSSSSNVSSKTPAIELLLRRIERIISTQDQQDIMLDNILRNLADIFQ
ncbi:hypothetical protein ILUMI_18357 [Ignelater luminosus]|uniref:Uncharacterized protein n=1 Tax=Ignelater luminosus TaxID=2038154 RepID=A0A8K0G473_IGNLU|nr:hypothetical protein ILUMI_18357 [Ignelater luminosus]